MTVSVLTLGASEEEALMVLGRSIVSSEFSKTASKVSGHSDHSTVPRVFG